VRLKIATFNVAGLPSALAPLRRRAPHFGRRLHEAAVDVVNLQEVWTPGILATVRAHLPSLGHVSWRRGVAGQPRGGLVTLSRHPIASTRYTSFRRARPSGPGQWVNTRLQGVLVTELETVRIANTHLTANRAGDWSPAGRYFELQRSQLELLHGATPACTILTGDCNVAASGPLYTTLRADYEDPFAATDRPTYHVDLLPPGRTGQRIDYALVRGHRVHAAGTLFDRPVEGLGHVSDHVALTVEVELS
jgi:endonuclease/exonuclease/phosphatase family metal-dependent hydrolase